MGPLRHRRPAPKGLLRGALRDESIGPWLVLSGREGINLPTGLSSPECQCGVVTGIGYDAQACACSAVAAGTDSNVAPEDRQLDLSCT